MNIEEARKKIKEVIYWSNGQKAEYIDISFCTYDDEINCEEFIEAMETVLNELDKKDKVIDMMAQELINQPIRVMTGNEIFKFTNKEDTLEYFYNKVEIPEKN